MTKLRSAIVMLTAAFVAALTHNAAAAVETYVIDSSHSSVNFEIRHFMTKFPGAFAKASGRILVDRDNLEQSSVEATVDTTSIDTRDARRDNNLRNTDYLFTEKFPTATFKSKSWKKTGENTFDVTGDLTIRDVTKEVVLKTTLLGFMPNSRGGMICGWEATTTIDRRDFGITAGQGMLGNEVILSLNIQSRLQAPPQQQ